MDSVRWCFSKQNIDDANRRILALTEKLSLPKIFVEDSKKLHSSSDGQKYGVSVPSLHARIPTNTLVLEKGYRPIVLSTIGTGCSIIP